MDFGGGDQIRFERTGKAGIVTLTRPKALNALTHRMVKALSAALTAWEDDRGVEVVILKAEGRAFCAGGDILEVYEAGRAGKQLDRILRRRVPAERPDQPLQETLCLADRRHLHGRRHGHFRARLAPGDDGERGLRHARGRHRLFPRCRRQLPAAQSRLELRHVSRPDRQQDRIWRRAVVGHRHAYGAGRVSAGYRRGDRRKRRSRQRVARILQGGAPQDRRGRAPRHRQAFLAGLAAGHRDQPGARGSRRQVRRRHAGDHPDALADQPACDLPRHHDRLDHVDGRVHADGVPHPQPDAGRATTSTKASARR